MGVITSMYRAPTWRLQRIQVETSKTGLLHIIMIVTKHCDARRLYVEASALQSTCVGENTCFLVEYGEIHTKAQIELHPSSNKHPREVP